jgi:tetratricopeptide (TPR) repeat protein
MFRNSLILAGSAAILAGGALLWPEVAQAQERQTRLDVEHYLIEAEVNPHTQSLTANVEVQFVPLDDYTSSASFELNNALNVSKVVDEKGQQIPASRDHDQFSLRLNFPEPLAKGKPSTLTFTYDGRLTGREDSPVYGIKFASIQNDYAYLLYPARWFPVNDYTVDRFTADLKITVPVGYRVVASGLETMDTSNPEKVTFNFRFLQSSFPGSLAVIQGEPNRISSQGVTTAFYFRGDARGMIGAYGEEVGKVMTYLTSVYGLPPERNLSVVETDEGTPNGYSAPGIVFLNPRSIGKQVNSRLLVNQIARQWWGTLLSPVTRNHLWITNGMARYAELLWLEHSVGPSAIEGEVHDNYIEALTVDRPPLIQSARLEDYSPEFWAATAGKGFAVLHMLRYVIGDEPFSKLLKQFPEQNAWKSVSTDDFRKAAEAASGKNLQSFFIEWIESSGAPEFKLEYTVFRTQKGFRVMGKISQDLDTFRMPVKLKIETEGNPEEKQVEVVGASSEFVVETFGKPKNVIIDPDNQVLRFNDTVRVAVATRRGEQFAEIGEFADALKEYQKALDVNRYSSLAHYRVAEVFFLQRNYQSAANEFREALNGDLEPKWTEVWAHINLGKIFDITGQRERAVNEYNLAIRTKDDTQGAQEEAAKYLQQPYERPRQAL